MVWWLIPLLFAATHDATKEKKDKKEKSSSEKKSSGSGGYESGWSRSMLDDPFVGTYGTTVVREGLRGPYIEPPDYYLDAQGRIILKEGSGHSA